MTPPALKQYVPPVDSQADLETVLAAWHTATKRLEQTHEALRGEVRRLTDELARKNRELARKNRLADLGQIATHVAHEVRNNLVPVTLYLSLLRRRLAEDRGSLDVLDKIDSGFADVQRMVHDLLHFTVEHDPRIEPVRVRALVHEVLATLAPQLAAQSIETMTDVPDAAVVLMDREMLRRAVFNLALNAIDVMPHGGQIVVTSYLGRSGFELEIADSGPGLSDEARQRAFEPFFSTKKNGIGLGLAIVYRIAEVHGGDVVATNCPDGGAAFTIRVPQRVLEAAA